LFSDDVLFSRYQGSCLYFNGIPTNKSLAGVITAHLKAVITSLSV